MAYTTIENFKYGRDARRSEFTSQPGTLSILDNGHVNQGGEVESRKAFVPYGGMDLVKDSLGDTGTFGLQDVFINGASYNAVFGSALPHGALINFFAEPLLNQALAAKFAYYQLRHPAVSTLVPYNRAQHRIISLACSTSFGGLPWASAIFADGSCWSYYNGVIVPSTFTGAVLSGHNSTTEIANAIGAAFQTFLPNFAVAVIGSQINLTAPAGDPSSFVIDVSNNVGTGTLTGVIVSDQSTAVPGKSAVTWFTIVSGSSGSLDSIIVPDVSALPNGTQDLLAGTPVPWNLSPTSMATAISAAINAHGVQGYSAKVFQNTTVQIYAPATAGAQVNNLKVTINYNGSGGDMSITAAGVPLSVTVSPTVVRGLGQGLPPAGRVLTTNAAAASASGGIAPYKYQWSELFGDASIKIVSPTQPSTTFSALMVPRSAKSGQFVCRVTDSSPSPLTTQSTPINAAFSGGI